MNLLLESLALAQWKTWVLVTWPGGYSMWWTVSNEEWREKE